MKKERSQAEMKIVFVTGWVGSGKDTFANVLVKHKGYRRFAFADPIKEMVAKEHNVPVELLHTQSGKQTVVNGTTLRQHCITLGETKRREDIEYWGKLIAQKIKESGCEKIVISDWRLLPELFAIQKAFPNAFIVPIRMNRATQYISSVPDLTEYSLLGFPFAFTIQNSGISEEELLDQINLLPL